MEDKKHLNIKENIYWLSKVRQR